MKNIRNVADVERRLNDGIEKTQAEHQECIRWLTEFMTANDMTLDALDDLCFENSDWVFQQIF